MGRYKKKKATAFLKATYRVVREAKGEVWKCRPRIWGKFLDGHLISLGRHLVWAQLGGFA